MIKFKTVALEDKGWMDRLIKLENSRNADCNFTNIYVWDDSFHQRVAECGNRLLVKLMYHGTPFYAFPIGKGDLEPVIMELKADADSHGTALEIRGITRENLELLEKHFPQKFEITVDTDVFDYIYSLEKMATLAGKKLHSKRNHIKRFEENNNWSFETITLEDIPQCIELCCRWVEESSGNGNTRAEHMALTRVFENYQALGLEGGVLCSGNEVIGFTIGERLNTDTYVVHFEKAIGSIQGAYAMINREFARFIREKYPDIQFVNREDDMGLENLRKAKRSYYPELMVEKYTAVLKH